MRVTELHNGQITMPRLTARQLNHSNVRANNALENFKLACFLPFTDTCIAQLDERFTRQAATAYQLSALLPAFLNSSKYEDIKPVAKVYKSVFVGRLSRRTADEIHAVAAILGATKDDTMKRLDGSRNPSSGSRH
jgi:hypothetical protein